MSPLLYKKKDIFGIHCRVW